MRTFSTFFILSFFLSIHLHAQYAPKDSISLNWENKTNLPDHITHMAQQEDYLFAATSNEVWRSADDGKTWEKKKNGNIKAIVASDSAVVVVSYSYHVDQNPTNGTFTAYSRHHLSTSLDSGENFETTLTKTAISTPFTSDNYDFKQLIVKNDSTFSCYFVYSTWGSFNGVWIGTEDKGLTWSEQNAPLYDGIAVSNDTIWGVNADFAYHSTNSFAPSSNWAIPDLGQGNSDVETALYDNGFLYIQFESGHVLRSNDGKFDWEILPDLQEDKLEIHSTGIYKKTVQAVLRADNPELTEWTSIWDFTGLPNDRAFFHNLFALDDISIAQTAGGILNTSLDYHSTWQQHIGIPSGKNYLNSFQYFNDKYWANGFDGALLSSDDFCNWQLEESTNYLEIMEFDDSKHIVHKTIHGEYLFAVTGGNKSLLRTLDGLTWESTGLDLPDNGGVVFQTLGDRLYIFSSAPNSWILYESNDNFSTWTEKSVEEKFTSFAVSNGHWLGTTNPSKQLLLSQDEGENWDTLFNGATFQVIRPKNDGTLLALTDADEATVWRSTDGGISWEQSGLPLEPLSGSDQFSYHHLENDIMQIRHWQLQPPNNNLEALLTANDGSSYTSIGPLPGLPAGNLIYSNDKWFSTNNSQLWVADSVPIDLLFDLYPSDTTTIQTQVCSGDIVNGTPINKDTLLLEWELENNSFHWTENHITVVDDFETQFDITLCHGETFDWNGTVYETSGNHVQSFQTSNGCDSTVTLSLDILPLDTVILSDILCDDQSIIINGTIYDIDNPTGWEYLPNATIYGCDSVIHIDLAFELPIEMTDTLALLPGDLFQGIPIYSDTIFIENLTTILGCDSTATTYIFIANATDDFFAASIDLNLFPNPTSNDFYIEMNLPKATKLTISMVDFLGRKTALFPANKLFPKGKQKIKVDASSWPAGQYNLSFRTETKIFGKKIMKY